MGGQLAVVPALEELGREGVLQTKDQSRPGPLGGRTGFGLASNFSFSKRGEREDWAGGAVGTMAVALGTLSFFITKGATQGGGLVPGSPK